MKFYYAKKMRFLLILMNLLKHTCWCGFFLLQGMAIQRSIEKNTLLKELACLLLGFVVIKVIVMSIDIVKQYMMTQISNLEIAKQWIVRFPKTLFRDNADKANLICLLYFDYLPNAFRLETSIMNHQYTLLSIAMVLTAFFVISQFYLGLGIAIMLFSFNFISKCFFLDRMSHDYLEITERKNQIFQWILDYFQSWREVSLCWKSSLNEWAENQYEDLKKANDQLIKTQLFRDITTQCFVELPFVLNISAMILAMYFNYLSMTHFFVWMGCSQFIIQASNAYAEKRAYAQQQKVLFKKIHEILNHFEPEVAHDTRLGPKELLRATRRQRIIPSIIPHKITVTLIDASEVQLSLFPGIYRVLGRNGSGKTTLLNTVLGYERLIKIDHHEALQSMLSALSQRNIRFIDRDAILFETLTCFDQQILGPQKNAVQQAWLPLFEKNMDTWLLPSEIARLKKYFKRLETNFYVRKSKTFSAGEKVLISLMRVLLSWNDEVFILIVDECTAFLDDETRDLFTKIIKQLSKNVAIYLTTHELFERDISVCTTLTEENEAE